jgi:hypothetical protein
MNKVLKWIIILVIVGLLLFLGLAFAFSSIFDIGEGKFYSKRDLINNYKNNKTSLYQLKDFYNKVVPDGKVVEIEFASDRKIARLSVTNLPNTSNIYHEQYFCDWNLNIHSYKVDSIIQSLGWTQTTLTTIKSKLDKANCIGVVNGEPTNISFHRIGFGMYSYDLFSGAVPVNLKSKYNDSCTHIFYNDKVVFEYGGGAIGPQCFPKQ